MIKRILKGLFIVGLALLPIGFTNAGYGNIQIFNQGVEYDIIGGGNSFIFQGNFNFLLDGQYKAFFRDWYRPYIDRHSMQWLFWHNGELYFMQNERNTNNIDLQGYIKSLHKCSYGYDPTDGTQNCSTLGTGDFYVSKYSNPDAFRKVSSDYEFACFDYDDLNESICITTTYADNFYNSLGFTYFPSLSELGTSVDQISSYFGTSFFGLPPNTVEVPVSNGLTGYNYISITGQDYVDYFESEYNFRKDMCYVGTKDLTGLYEDRVVYHQGTGYTIFDTYSILFNTNSIKISELGTFLNMWKLNYGEWFVEQGNSFVAYYSGVGDYGFDRGGTLSNPFLGNRAVYFFIGGDFYDYNVNVINSDGNIHNLALYCYYKLIDKSNDGGTFDITDDHDSVVDEWVAVYSRNKRNSGFYFSGSSEIVGQSWNGTPLDYFTGGDDNIDFGTFFSDSFTKFKGAYLPMDAQSFGVGFLPGYIILFLLAIIFFRFLSH